MSILWLILSAAFGYGAYYCAHMSTVVVAATGKEMYLLGVVGFLIREFGVYTYYMLIGAAIIFGAYAVVFFLRFCRALIAGRAAAVPDQPEQPEQSHYTPDPPAPIRAAEDDEIRVSSLVRMPSDDDTYTFTVAGVLLRNPDGERRQDIIREIFERRRADGSEPAISFEFQDDGAQSRLLIYADGKVIGITPHGLDCVFIPALYRFDRVRNVKIYKDASNVYCVQMDLSIRRR